MPKFARITLLGSFAAAGAAAAIAIATRPLPTLAPTGELAADVAFAAPPAASPDASDNPAPAAGPPPSSSDSAWPPAPPPQPVPEEARPGPVLQQVEQLEATIQQLQESSRENQALLRETLSTLQDAAPGVIPPGLAPVAPAAPPLAAPPAAAAPETPLVPAPAGDPFADDAESLPTPARAQIDLGADDRLTINLKDADLRDVLEQLSLQTGVNILAAKGVQGTITAALTHVNVYEALDGILHSTGYQARKQGGFVYVGTPADLKQIEQLRDRVGTRIYRPNYVTAAELQALLTPMLTAEEGRVTVSSPAQQGIGADTSAAGGDDFAGAEVVLVRDFEAVLREVDSLVAEVDRPPAQVAIEAMILSVRLNDENRWGVDFALLESAAALRLVSGAPATGLAALDTLKGGLHFSYLNSTTPVFIEALETFGDTNIVASPRLMCLNKQKAEILIGQQRGYLTTTQTETATTQTVEFLEVGTQLRIRPFIGADGMIRLEVHPELSTGDIRLLGGFALPDKDVTQVTTNIMCPDGCTVVIGGLIREELADTGNRMPVLSNLRFIGPLFRKSTESTRRTEVIVLLTPRIVQDDAAAAEGELARAQWLQRQDVYADEMNPFNKTHYAQRYARWAQEAWEAGNTRRALRLINFSIHVDPQNFEAIALRDAILAAGPGVTPAGFAEEDYVDPRYEGEFYEAEGLVEEPLGAAADEVSPPAGEAASRAAPAPRAWPDASAPYGGAPRRVLFDPPGEPAPRAADAGLDLPPLPPTPRAAPARRAPPRLGPPPAAGS